MSRKGLAESAWLEKWVALPAVGPEPADPADSWSLVAGDLAPSQAPRPGGFAMPTSTARGQCWPLFGYTDRNTETTPRLFSQAELQYNAAPPCELSGAPRVGWAGWTPPLALGTCRVSRCITRDSEDARMRAAWVVGDCRVKLLSTAG